MSDEKTHLDLFSGIGGFSIAAEWAGFRTIAHAEIDAEASIVLAAHWPDVPNLGSVKGIGVHSSLGRVDLLTAGVPCQPASLLGKRLGSADERWLWPETLRIVRELRPRFCVFENPPAILSLESGRAFSGILGEMAGIGYDVLWGVIPAAAMGAGHLRKRVCIVATDSNDSRLQGHTGNADDNGRREKAARSTAPRDLRGRVNGPDWWHETNTGVPVLAHGVSAKLAKAAARCTGNAVVPQVFYPVLKSISDLI